MHDLWRHRLESLPLQPPTDPGGRVLVVSAHPDDEVLAVGAWLAGQTGRDIVFVTATDGEASHPGSPTITPAELRVRRPRELVTALGHLGFDAPAIHRLKLPDGGLEREHSRLHEALAPLMQDADLVVVPFESDGHPDHDALGRIGIELCPPESTLWRVPIWTWAWSRPGEQPWLSSVRRLECSPANRHRKRRAISAFTSQVRPLSSHPADQAVVDGTLLRHATFAPEVVVA